MTASRELVIPPTAVADPKTVEMIRVWIADGGLHCALNIGHWTAQSADIEETTAWGILLSEVIRHVANAAEEQTGADPTATTKAIFRSLRKELGVPTADASGGFVNAKGDGE